LDNNEEVTQAE